MRSLSTTRPLVVAGEAKIGFGEDAYAVGSTEDGLCYLGVFDGCGGLGGRHYAVMDNHTGAWTAARAVAYGTETFLLGHGSGFGRNSGEALQQRLTDLLGKVKSSCTERNAIQIGGELKKNFPTTVSLIVAEESSQNDELTASFLWAGDSRGYFLDAEGLCQMTQDDIDANGEDAFQNLREDGRLTNVANADTPFALHMRSVRFRCPVMLLTATDGCFAYFKTPMDFELLLLDTLMRASSPEEWLAKIRERLQGIAGDDFTLTLGLFGFSTFRHMQLFYRERYRKFVRQFIEPEQQAAPGELEALWQAYRPNYYRRGLSWD